MLFPGFVGGTYQAAALLSDAQRAVNLIPEPVESGTGTVAYAYRGAPGKHVFTTLPTTPVRGLWPGAGRLFAAAGSRLYEVFSNGTYTDRGDIGNDGGPVEMFPNGNELYIVSNGRAYIDSGSGPVAQTFVGGGNVTASTGAVLDDFFVAVKPDSKEYFLSSTDPGTGATVWDPLDFSSKAGYPDAIASCIADHKELWLFGFETTECHRDEGAADFPFQEDPGAFNHLGIAAPFSRVRLDAALFALVADARGKIWAAKFQGFMPKRISTHAIEKTWSSYSTVLDAVAYSYVEDGHSFWVISFPTANATWCFDATTGIWHERAWWDGSALQRDRGASHAYVFGKHLVGDHTNGKIYEQSFSITDDFGGDRRYERTAPYVAIEEHRVFHARLQAAVETGAGAITAALSWSDDEGGTYTTPKTKTAASSKRNARMIWRRLGESRHRIYKLTITTQEKVAIPAAYIDITPGLK
jgi:hypothetical protein